MAPLPPKPTAVHRRRRCRPPRCSQQQRWGRCRSTARQPEQRAQSRRPLHHSSQLVGVGVEAPEPKSPPTGGANGISIDVRRTAPGQRRLQRGLSQQQTSPSNQPPRQQATAKSASTQRTPNPWWETHAEILGSYTNPPQTSRQHPTGTEFVVQQASSRRKIPGCRRAEVHTVVATRSRFERLRRPCHSEDCVGLGEQLAKLVDAGVAVKDTAAAVGGLQGRCYAILRAMGRPVRRRGRGSGGVESAAVMAVFEAPARSIRLRVQWRFSRASGCSSSRVWSGGSAASRQG